mmetsp:Transcript_69/g.205  ORF Transcript_69/g.205 Transcript_69/m.205 type:complete len:274 (+) Transcript_69:451-1272(+)
MDGPIRSSTSHTRPSRPWPRQPRSSRDQALAGPQVAPTLSTSCDPGTSFADEASRTGSTRRSGSTGVPSRAEPSPTIEFPTKKLEGESLATSRNSSATSGPAGPDGCPSPKRRVTPVPSRSLCSARTLSPDALLKPCGANPDGKTRTRLRRAIVMDMTPTSILPGAFSRCLTTVGRVLAWASHLKLAALLHRDQIAAAWSLQPVPGTSNTRPKPPCFPAPQETLSASVCRSIRGVAVATCVDGPAQSALVSGLESIGAPIGPKRDWRVRGPNE